MIEAIIFDFGGVCLLDADPMDDIASSFKADRDTVLKNFEGLLEDYQKGKISDQNLWLSFSQRMGKDLPEGYETLWTRQYALKTRINTEVVSVAMRLKQKGYRLGILSNTIPPHAKFNKEKNFFQGFDEVILSCEVGLRKPEKEIYMLAARALRVEPCSCVYIDDREEYLLPAKQLGMKTIHYQNTKNLVFQLKGAGVNL